MHLYTQYNVEQAINRLQEALVSTPGSPGGEYLEILRYAKRLLDSAIAYEESNPPALGSIKEFNMDKLYLLVEAIKNYNKKQREEDNPLFVIIEESIIDSLTPYVFGRKLKISTILDFLKSQSEQVEKHNTSIGVPPEGDIDNRLRYDFYTKSKPYWEVKIIPEIIKEYKCL